MNKRKLYLRLLLIVVVTVLAVLATIPSGPDINIGSWHKRLFIHEGLDLKGGVSLTYKTDLSQIPANQQNDALISLKSLVDSRINKLGVSEPVIQTGSIGGNTTLLVELPGVANVEDAIKTIGKFPDLKFYDEGNNVIVTGQDVQSSQVTFGTSNGNSSPGNNNVLGEPEVTIKFKDVGKQKFADATTAAFNANPHKTIRIELDGQVISDPVVNAPITDGTAVISGNFTVESAKQLTSQLNEGALPVPITIIGQQTIGPTLGIASLKNSLIAGLIGLILIALFMILYYRIPGILAILALTIYTFINIALYKFIPVTITLAGVAGFILSIGMAVDANILIFERMKEEARAGKTQLQAVDEGFKRAWSSIRDSNVSTLITALILYWGTAGLIKGFALTLAIGVLVSLFTAITVTQVLLKLLMSSKFKHLIRT